jgi:nicotinamide mononucleotide adenylyltransferase
MRWRTRGARRGISLEGIRAAALLARVKTAVIARWKPPTWSHAALLDALVAGPDTTLEDEVLIGIGSSNRRDPRNPFSAAETAGMLEAYVRPRAVARWRVFAIEDLGDGPRWADLVHGRLGPLDRFVTGNAWVARLLRERYTIVDPRQLIPPDRRVPFGGSEARLALARGGEAWRAFVPPEVAAVLCDRGLVERFRREFGLATLARMATEEVGRPRALTAEEEERHVRLG